MKCLGLIGGIGWESTALYYRLINEDVQGRRGSLHSARLIVNSLEFEPLNSAVKAGDWNAAGAVLASAARILEGAGADALVLCSNLMHHVAGHIEAAVRIPLLHLGDAIAEEVRGTSAHIGLLGTRFTLEHGFLLNRRPHPRWGTPKVYTPRTADCERLDRIIYDELCRGVVSPVSTTELLRMAGELRQQGAQLVVLASSELGLLLPPRLSVPDWLCGSTDLHAQYAVRWALDETKPAVDRTKPAMAGGGLQVMKRSKLALSR